jgi:hypothetical protein
MIKEKAFEFSLALAILAVEWSALIKINSLI